MTFLFRHNSLARYLILVLGLLSLPLAGQNTESEVSLIPGNKSFSTTGQNYLYLSITPPEGWYAYYYNNSVVETIRPTLTFESIVGVTYGNIEYPEPKIKSAYDVPSYVYPGQNYFRIPVTLSSDIKVGATLNFRALANWQICKDSCINESREVTTSVTVGNVASESHSDLPANIQRKFPITPEFEITAKRDESNITLILSKVIETPYFYDLDGQAHLIAEQDFKIEGGITTITLPLDEGNYLRQDLNPTQANLTGILSNKSSGILYKIETPLENYDLEKVTQIEAQPNSVEKSNTEIAKEAEEPAALITLPSTETLSKLYSPDEPIAYQTLNNSAPTTLWLAIGGAFLGGMLLNLMPCVFPVLSLKVLSFVEKAGEDKWKVRLHGILFTVGVTLSMWILASALFWIKASTGESVNWGQQMGDPRFVAAIVIILFLFGLNMAGIFEIGTKLTSVGGAKESKNDYLQTIFSGVLTTIIATPCSGPFLGAAMGYTLEQPLEVALLIFTIFALGISFPYLILSFFPALTAKLPRPGAWMETLKVTLSFGMFAAVAFFMKTFGAQVGSDGLATLMMGLVIIALAAYFYGHWTRPHLKKATRYGLGIGLSCLVLATGLKFSWDATTHKAAEKKEVVNKAGIIWHEWQPGIVEHLRAEGKYVWVDYTASWCATCIFNKKVIFNDEELLSKLDSENLIFVKADLTENDPVIAKDLSRVNRAQIPVNLLYSPNKEKAILLEELIPTEDVTKGLEKLEYFKKKVE